MSHLLFWNLFIYFWLRWVLFIYFWLCWVFVAARAGSSRFAASGTALVCGFLTAVASLVVELGSGVWASEAAAREPSSCISRAPERRFSGCGTWTQVLCGVDLLDQKLRLCLLHWRVDSFPLSHQGSPVCFLIAKIYLNFQFLVPLFLLFIFMNSVTIIFKRYLKGKEIHSCVWCIVLSHKFKILAKAWGHLTF